MLRISKVTDYGIVVMTYLANNATTTHTAKDIAQHTHITLPTVSKLLKLLARTGLLIAHRGVKGGYGLAFPAEKISLAQIIHAIEGDIGLTECSHNAGSCSMEPGCAVRSNWRMISNAIRGVLTGISLAEMIKPIANNIIQQNINKLAIENYDRSSH